MSKTDSFQKRKRRTRTKIANNSDRLRLSVYRSLKHMYAQIIDDKKGETLVSADSREDLKGEAGDREGKVKDAYLVGLNIARRAQEENIDEVVFDRSGYKYHGRVKAVAEGAREGGLNF